MITVTGTLLSRLSSLMDGRFGVLEAHRPAAVYERHNSSGGKPKFVLFMRGDDGQPYAFSAHASVIDEIERRGLVEGDKVTLLMRASAHDKSRRRGSDREDGTCALWLNATKLLVAHDEHGASS